MKKDTLQIKKETLQLDQQLLQLREFCNKNEYTNARRHWTPQAPNNTIEIFIMEAMHIMHKRIYIHHNHLMVNNMCHILIHNTIIGYTSFNIRITLLPINTQE